jgi:hypothetical protein
MSSLFSTYLVISGQPAQGRQIPMLGVVVACGTGGRGQDVVTGDGRLAWSGSVLVVL